MFIWIKYFFSSLEFDCVYPISMAESTIVGVRGRKYVGAIECTKVFFYNNYVSLNWIS